MHDDVLLMLQRIRVVVHIPRKEAMHKRGFIDVQNQIGAIVKC